MELKKFKNKDLEELANGLELPSKSPYKNIEIILQKKLKILLDAEKWQDLQIFPNNNPEKLKGSKIKNLCSMRVSQQYRLIFIWVIKPERLTLTSMIKIMVNNFNPNFSYDKKILG